MDDLGNGVVRVYGLGFRDWCSGLGVRASYGSRVAENPRRYTI